MLPTVKLEYLSLFPPQDVYKTVSMRLNIVSPDLSGEYRTVDSGVRWWGDGVAALGGRGGFLRLGGQRGLQ